MGDSKGKSQRKKQKRFLHWLSLMSTIKSHIRKMKNPLLHFGQGRSRNVWCEKCYIASDENERRIIINSLNNLRNKLIENNRYTDAVDEILIKILSTPIKKFKITEI